MASTSWAAYVSTTRPSAAKLAIALSACLASGAAVAARPQVPRYAHIFVIIEENQGLDDILNKPFTPKLTALAKQYGLATQYYGVVHPSEGNYVAMLGGDTFGIHDDDAYFCKPNSTEPVCKRSRAPDYGDHTIHQPNLADQLTAQGLTWKAYEESLPSPGAMDVTYPKPGNSQHLPAALYASKHNGFMAFASVQNDPHRAGHIVGFDTLETDLSSGKMPAFAHIVPNQCNDMHGVKGDNVPPDCTKENEPGRIVRGDADAGKLVDKIMHSPVWSAPGNSAIVITFDEASHHIYPGDPLGCCGWDPAKPSLAGGGRIATIVIANHGPRGIQDATPYNHFSLLRTIEDALGIQDHLGHAADDSKGVVTMQPLFAVAR